MARGRHGNSTVAVVGGGVVGCAIAREFALCGLEVILFEKSADILGGASKANSAILHTGYDARPGSLEAHLIREGRTTYLALAPRFGLPIDRTGGLVVAWREEERARLDELLARAEANGVRDLEPLTAAEVRAREPQIAAGARAAIRVPGEYLVDPWTTPLAYALQAIAHGAEINRGTEVLDFERRPGGWLLRTNRDTFRADIVVNAAGLFADRLEARVRRPRFRIRPRKGQFLVYDKPARRLLWHILYPVPSAASKGILLAPTIFGNLLVGPTSQPVQDPTDTSTDGETLRELRILAERRLPALASMRVVAAYAGLRPATDGEDYVIEADRDRGWITVAGIRSTGLTSALGIAAYVRELFSRHFGTVTVREPRSWPSLPQLAENGTRPYARGGFGEIICFCELVTRGEIEAALEGPLPARDLSALKRRTRCTMGRCQGFYCAWRVAQMLQVKGGALAS